MIPIRWNPDRKTLREFAGVGSLILGLIAGPVSYVRGHPRAALASWAIAIGLVVLGLARPRWLKPVYLGLTLATWPVGWVVSKLALVLLYFGVFTPIALFFRLIGRDALHRKFDPRSKTYWEAYQPDRGIERYLRPF